MSESSDDKKIRALLDYFKLADQGSPEVLDLFHEDVELYFPKFGFGVGRQAFLEFVKGFEGTLEFIRHDYDKLTFISATDHSGLVGSNSSVPYGRALRRGIGRTGAHA